MSKKTFSEVCKEAYERYGGYTPEAVDYIVHALDNDKEMRRDALHTAAVDGLRQEQRDRRRVISERASSVVRVSSSVQKEVVRRCAGLMSWPLMNGTPLGKATREMVLDNATRFTKHGKTALRNGRFLELVGGSLTAGQVVSQKLKEEQLQELWDRAANEVCEVSRNV